LKPAEKKALINLYEHRLGKYGVAVKTVGWRDRWQQNLRFKIISEMGDMHNRKILDVGCGFGDFYDYLLKRGIRVRYKGYDFAPRIIEAAKDARPHLSFGIKDILKDKTRERFDYVVASGILNKRISGNYKYAGEIINKMFGLCRIGIGINMMTNYVDFRENFLFHYSPEKILRFAKKLSRYVTIRHDYPLHEFTLYVYRKNNEKNRLA